LLGISKLAGVLAISAGIGTGAASSSGHGGGGDTVGDTGLPGNWAVGVTQAAKRCDAALATLAAQVKQGSDCAPLVMMAMQRGPFVTPFPSVLRTQNDNRHSYSYSYCYCHCCVQTTLARATKATDAEAAARLAPGPLLDELLSAALTVGAGLPLSYNGYPGQASDELDAAVDEVRHRKYLGLYLSSSRPLSILV